MTQGSNATETIFQMITAAAQHNSFIRPNPRVAATRAMMQEHTLIAALYCEVDERFTRAQVEAALIELSRAGRVWIFPENVQSDLTEYDNSLALYMGGQHKHWVSVAG